MEPARRRIPRYLGPNHKEEIRTSKLVEVQDVVVRFYTYEGVVKALEGVTAHVVKGETLGLVGETGCGKTMTGLSIFNLIPPPGQVEGGKILFKGKDGKVRNLLDLEENQLQQIRGEEVAMIFQEPSSALNPVYTVNEQVSEVFLTHRKESLIKNVLADLEEDSRTVQENSRKGRTGGFHGNIYRKMLEHPDSLSQDPIKNAHRQTIQEKDRNGSKKASGQDSKRARHV